VSVPVWAWVAFAAFVVAMLALDLFVLHRRAQEVSPTEAARWTAVWLVIGLGFGGLLCTPRELGGSRWSPSPGRRLFIRPLGA